MSESKAEVTTETEETAQNESESASTEAKKQQHTLATGLEDYGRWKAMFKDYKRKENEPPFRRGRIWS